MRNMGWIDRALRIAIGVVLITLVFTGPKTLWGLLGVIPLTTAFAGYCPLYRVLGIRTSRKLPEPKAG